MRSLMADTTALVLFFTLTGVLNERFIAGMDWQEVGLARLIGTPLMIITARPYGLWRDLVMATPGAAIFGRPKALLFDTLALLSFQVPIYAAIIWMGGASGAGLLWGIVGAAVIVIFCGRPYGLWLEIVRRWYGVGQPHKERSGRFA